MVQTVERAITQMRIDKEKELGELLSVIVNSIPAKRGKNGCSLYEMMFAAFSVRLLSPAINPVEALAFNGEEFYQELHHETRNMDVFTIQSRAEERYSLDIQLPINSFSVDV